MKQGVCHICGENKILSRAHYPPEAAFNKYPILKYKIDEAAKNAELRYKKVKGPGGGANAAYILCEDCNNYNGCNYDRAYADFVKQIAQYSSDENAGKILQFNCSDIYPMRIAKAALSIICATSGPELCETNPGLRKLLRNRDCKGVPQHLRLFIYLRLNSGGRASGPAAVLNTKTGDTKIIIEFSWWPLGIILTFEDQIIDNAQEITHWLQNNYDDKKTVSLNLPCYWAATPFPIDFRTPAQVLKEAEESRKFRGRHT